ncbi:MAG: FAD-dependent monooxygenase [Sphingobium sp.]
MTSAHLRHHPRVVIIGAGPTGLALAIELGSRSIPCLVIERTERGGYAPRAKTTHVRTREHLRRWGIAEKLAAASPFGVDYPSAVHFVTRLGGWPLAKFEDALNCSPARDERYNEHGQWIPQYKLEAVLRDHAQSLPDVTIRFGQEYRGFTQDEDGVRVDIHDSASGHDWTVKADYLVGADGARSLVRDTIGAKMVGTYGLSRNYNIIFEAPGLAEAHPQGPGIMYWQVNADTPSLIGRMDEGDLWYFMPTMLPPGVTLSDEEALDLIRRSTGIDMPYRILSSDEWVASRLLADHYRLGRVFLAGDACHLHPPFGGFGMNMGVSDAVDLGWKLAARLQGWGGEALLGSYEAERRPVHEMVLDEAEGNHSVLANQLYRPGMEEDSAEGARIREEMSALIREVKYREFNALGIVLGYRYLGSPIIADDGSSDGWKMARDYVPSAAPGALAPHRWLDDGQSLYDLFGADFTLLVMNEAAAQEAEAIVRDAQEAGIPLTLLSLPQAGLEELYEARMALIRPDQHVAWRGDHRPARAILEQITGHGAVPVHGQEARASA